MYAEVSFPVLCATVRNRLWGDKQWLCILMTRYAQYFTFQSCRRNTWIQFRLALAQRRCCEPCISLYNQTYSFLHLTTKQVCTNRGDRLVQNEKNISKISVRAQYTTNHLTLTTRARTGPSSSTGFGQSQKTNVSGSVGRCVSLFPGLTRF